MCSFNEVLKMLSNTPVVFLSFPKYLLLILVCLYIFLKLFIIQSFFRVVAYIFGEATLPFVFLLPFPNGSTVKRKNLLLLKFATS